MWDNSGLEGTREKTIFLATTDGAVAVDQNRICLNWATDTEQLRLRTPNAQFGVPVTHLPHVYTRAPRAT